MILMHFLLFEVNKGSQMESYLKYLLVFAIIYTTSLITRAAIQSKTNSSSLTKELLCKKAHTLAGVLGLVLTIIHSYTSS